MYIQLIGEGRHPGGDPAASELPARCRQGSGFATAPAARATQESGRGLFGAREGVGDDMRSILISLSAILLCADAAPAMEIVSASREAAASALVDILCNQPPPPEPQYCEGLFPIDHAAGTSGLEPFSAAVSAGVADTCGGVYGQSNHFSASQISTLGAYEIVASGEHRLAPVLAGAMDACALCEEGSAASTFEVELEVATATPFHLAGTLETFHHADYGMGDGHLRLLDLTRGLTVAEAAFDAPCTAPCMATTAVDARGLLEPGAYRIEAHTGSVGDCPYTNGPPAMYGEGAYDLSLRVGAAAVPVLGIHAQALLAGLMLVAGVRRHLAA